MRIFRYSDSEEEDYNTVDSDIEVSGILCREEEGSQEEEGRVVDSEEAAGDRQFVWTERFSSVCIDQFVSPSGKTFDLQDDCREGDVFSELFTDNMLQEIVRESNLYASQKLSAERFAKFSAISLAELKAFLGICIVMGVNTLPKTADYWSTDPYLGNDGIKRVMTKNRFEELSRFLHFNNSEEEPPKTDPRFDRLYKVRPVLEYFNRKMLEVYQPGKNLSVDETMIAFKGRLAFRQYMPNKPIKYGIKVWVAADSSNGFALKQKVYLGKDGERSEDGLGYDVVTGLVEPFANKIHHVYFDNYFCGVKLLCFANM